MSAYPEALTTRKCINVTGVIKIVTLNVVTGIKSKISANKCTMTKAETWEKQELYLQ
jgi:hypothetical protein